MAPRAKTAKMVMVLPMVCSAPPPVPGPHRPADGDGAAHGQAHDDDREHMGHLAAHGDGGDGVGPVILAGDEEVRQAVEGLQEAGEEVGERSGAYS